MSIAVNCPECGALIGTYSHVRDERPRRLTKKLQHHKRIEHTGIGENSEEA